MSRLAPLLEPSARETPRPGDLLPLLPVLLVLGWVWAPVLALPLSGEDYAILSRLARGEAGTPHVFRPLPDLLLAPVHGLFGVGSAVPYHALGLGLHVLAAGLVFLLGHRLFRSAWGGAAAAAVFALDAAATDALAWSAALNRPLSTAAALVVWNGLVRVQGGGSLVVIAVLGGLGLQLGTNAEGYGTAGLILAWTGVVALRDPRARPRALVLAAGAAILALAHFVFLQRVPGGAGDVLSAGLGGVVESVRVRSAAIAVGLGLPTVAGPLLPAGCALVAWLTGRRTAALFGLAAWFASLVPFAFSDAVGYRFYATLAPTGLLAGAALLGVGTRLAGERRGGPVVLVLVLVASVLGSQGARTGRLRAWERSLREIEACREPVLRLAESEGRPPLLVNLEVSTAGLFLYAFDVELGDLEDRGFLDAASGHGDPGPDPGGTWFGRRCDGSYGRIEPELYFAGRPRVDELALYGAALPVASLQEARRALADPALLDVTRVAVVEAEAELLAPLDPSDVGPPGRVDVLEPLEWRPSERRGALVVRVRTGRPSVLALQFGTLYHGLFRFAPDQALLSRVREPRAAHLTAHDAATGEELPTFFVNAFGLGALVPAGEHELVLELSLLRGPDLR